MSKLDLWNKVEKTDPRNTKPCGYGAHKYTAIDAYSQIKKATEIFGAYGKGWGMESIEISFAPCADIAVFKGKFFYTEGSSFGSFPVTTSCLMVSAKGKADEDFAKKMETDAITKALSRLGFNADVFMGKFDDQKYVNEMRGEFSEESKPVKKQKPAKVVDVIGRVKDALSKEDNVDALEKVWGEKIVPFIQDKDDKLKDEAQVIYTNTRNALLGNVS